LSICSGVFRTRTEYSSGLIKAGLKLYFLLANEPCYIVVVRYPGLGVSKMEWTTPQHEEVDLNCEISSYSNAEL